METNTFGDSLKHEEGMVIVPGSSFPEKRHLIDHIMRNQWGTELGRIVDLKSDAENGFMIFTLLPVGKSASNVKKLFAVPINHNTIRVNNKQLCWFRFRVSPLAI